MFQEVSFEIGNEAKACAACRYKGGTKVTQLREREEIEKSVLKEILFILVRVLVSIRGRGVEQAASHSFVMCKHSH